MLLSAYNHSEDLIRIGAYTAGTDPVLDKAIAALPAITAFLQQRREQKPTLEETLQQLMALPACMPFRFSLSAVLRLRESLERREYLALQALHAQVAETRSDIKALEQKLVQARIQRSNRLQEGIFAAHLQLELAGETRIEHKRQALTRQACRIAEQSERADQ